MGRESVLRSQGIDLAESVRRSIGMFEEEERGVYGDERRKEGGAKGEQRVEVREKEGAGVWSEEDLMDVGTWIGRVMR